MAHPAAAAAVALVLALVLAHTAAAATIKQVLLLTFDGLHAQDLTYYITTHPRSQLAALKANGILYPNAIGSKPSDSFPGLLNVLTGGSPRSHGVYYDVSYDSTLSPPGSACKTVGTVVTFDESIDFNSTALFSGGIDVSQLPLDPKKNCTPVYPHQFLRANTIFEVAKAAKLRTAWADKHPAYDIVNGPSGKGVDDLYTPEVNSVPSSQFGAPIMAYDSLHTTAILRQINGFTSNGTASKTPNIFGGNYQTLSYAQKNPAPGGYRGPNNLPGPAVEQALSFLDGTLKQFVGALQARRLYSSTLIVIFAKHGQSPLNGYFRRIISADIGDTIATVSKTEPAQVTADDIALIWLNDPATTIAVAAALVANRSALGIAEVLTGYQIQLRFGDSANDPRIPDIIVLPVPGVIYAGASATKIAEHGGFSLDDVNTGLLMSNPKLFPTGKTVYAEVSTSSIGPTVLQALGLKPSALQAATAESTPTLPGF
eukprot:SM000141S00913  [mRNA]  locus=s141:381552:384936:- [translate_table: standard]